MTRDGAMPVKLRRVGFFRELRHGQPDGPELRSLVSDTPQASEDRILQYLRSGVLFIATPAFVEDVLAPGNRIGSPHIFTDGVWAWPGDLAYYVAKYHARLPVEFVAHMDAQDFAAPTEDSVSVEQLEF
jgi:hypothetical protein